VLSKLLRLRPPKTKSTRVGVKATEDWKRAMGMGWTSDTVRLARDFSYELANRDGLDLRRPDAVHNSPGLFDDGMVKLAWPRKREYPNDWL
jgi:hypothetical protein